MVWFSGSKDEKEVRKRFAKSPEFKKYELCMVGILLICFVISGAIAYFGTNARHWFYISLFALCISHIFVYKKYFKEFKIRMASTIEGEGIRDSNETSPASH